jgi:hypothetical protein
VTLNLSIRSFGFLSLNLCFGCRSLDLRSVFISRDVEPLRLFLIIETPLPGTETGETLDGGGDPAFLLFGADLTFAL